MFFYGDAQYHRISVNLHHAMGVYELLDEPDLGFDEVKGLVQTAHERFKENKFLISINEKFASNALAMPVYNV